MVKLEGEMQLGRTCRRCKVIVEITLNAVEITNKMQPCIIIYYFHRSLEAQHVSSGIPLIIRSSNCICRYLQPLVYIRMWRPAVVKSDWELGHHMRM